ncbi:ATP-dependent zinc metalloprotease FtsH [Hydrangea phyllody phytoplasma]|uniref:ATP-dependent zinc metalloprotease FtsH n=2 Tax=16SrI (Aster yellows group) TaxID=3042590 RepID=A0ABQ5PTY1_9MOLU|nr:ATP-dependent zinc metalloprotease FtsH [Hydrangea phyllody phytoplasma]GFZ75275.1 ATP-dependent zinc metalloprotease FtsH [Hydrangea phyllody phytoplasma]GLH61557.1 ATP-dependent zinc metalloprotease FtsH [Rhus yellows phytoplasma]
MNLKHNKIMIVILSFVFLCLICLVLEWFQEYYNRGKLLNNFEIFQKIRSKENNIQKINIYEVGDSVLRKNSCKKIEIEENNAKYYYSFVDISMYMRVLDFLEQNDKFIPYEFRPKLSPLSLMLNFFSDISSIVFLFYIVLSIKDVLPPKYKKYASSLTTLLTFKDVAGNEEEKEELKELIDFLQQPQKYEKMGAQIPKGVLLSGPPGTGKTLLAKALAGEAGVPFYAVSGSEFVEMYVGVGASRIRELFKEAKQNTPCVLFIDEIDVLGGKRSNSDSGGSQEKDQTLNQLLTEMDGFTKSLGVIVIAATNRVDVLDDALLRPGRFDRQFNVGLPDIKARQAILKVHARNKKIAKSVDFLQLAKQTPGMSGAQLAAVLNESSILAVRNNKDLITLEELEEAIDRVLMGPAKKSIKYNQEERKMVAYHEAGHAIIGLKLEHAQKVQKITIIPRGNSGGYNLMMPEKETFFSSKKRMLAQITSYLGGRVAEELIFDDISSGAYDDFRQATNIAKLMVTKYGMSDLGVSQDSEFSDKILIDKEIKKIIDNCYLQAKEIISQNKSLLDKITNLLLEQETITKEEIDKLDTDTKMTQDPQETKTTTTTKSKSKQNTKTKRKFNSTKKVKLNE